MFAIFPPFTLKKITNATLDVLHLSSTPVLPDLVSRLKATIRLEFAACFASEFAGEKEMLHFSERMESWSIPRAV